MIIVLVGMIVGAFVSLPFGPLGIICTQKTINHGWKAGFLAGLGAALSDLIYSTTAIFGVSFIHNFISNHYYFINIFTGSIFFIFGLKVFLNPLNTSNTKGNKRELMHPTLSVFLFGMSNPLTFLIFLTIFAKISIEIDINGYLDNIVFVSSIFIGAALFWFFAAKAVNHSRKTFKIETFSIINKISGILLALFGAYSILKGLLQF